MKVKIFMDEEAGLLEEQINTWLEDYGPATIIKTATVVTAVGEKRDDARRMAIWSRLVSFTKSMTHKTLKSLVSTISLQYLEALEEAFESSCARDSLRPSSIKQAVFN